MDKKVSRLRRAVPTRRKISELRVHRLSIFRSNQHIYANIISPEGDRVLVSASTVEAEENCAVMVVDNVREFLENGNVTRSVNFPETVLQRTRPHRVAIPHKNVPNMVAQILTCLAAQNINIADMLNHSRDELSYTLVDLDTQPTEETLERIRGIDGILSVRVLPILDA